MPATLDPAQPAFTLAQLRAIVGWSAGRPFGLCSTIVTSHPQFLELIEVFAGDPLNVRYLLHPTESGAVVLTRAEGGVWELPTIERALTRLLMLEECRTAP